VFVPESRRARLPLVICARDAAELERAAGQLRGAGAEVPGLMRAAASRFNARP
jgi:hypothetical protein